MKFRLTHKGNALISEIGVRKNDRLNTLHSRAARSRPRRRRQHLTRPQTIPRAGRLSQTPDPVHLTVGRGRRTDTTARIVDGLPKEQFGQPVNLINRTGGSGVVGHAAIAGVRPDGYTIGLLL